MPRFRTFVPVIVVFLGIFLFASAPAEAAPWPQAGITAAPTFDPSRLSQPPTVYPPSQANNGVQLYWGMCKACHGDRGQGLTGEWRASFPPEEQDCWQSGCHSGDAPENSFEIPQTGVPVLTGPGTLSRFTNASDLHNFILESMPFFPTGSLTDKEAWELTAYILRMNDRQLAGFTLSESNSSAIPVHRDVALPGSTAPGVLALTAILILAAVGLSLRAKWEAVDPPVRPNFFHHLHPPGIPAEQSRFRYTLGAGGLAVFLSLVLLVTGLLEMYFYVPTPEQAAISVATLTALVPFGSLVRNLHYWSAQFLVIVMTVHLLRVALTGAYAPPRRFNYLLGLGLLVFILLLDFTGYVLRWDEGIRWALVVGTNLLKTVPWIGEGLYRFVIGGAEPGLSTLIRFYAWHIFGLTLGAAILIIWHAFRVRRDGGVAVPPPAQRAGKQRITRFELLRREVLAMIIIGAVLLLFSWMVPAPIKPPITIASVMSGDSQAPWFFLWVQQLLKWGNPFVLGVLMPVLVVVTLGLLPYILPNAKTEEWGRWFPSGNRLAQALTVSIIFAILVLTVTGALSR